jgi:hypothetical protein
METVLSCIVSRTKVAAVLFENNSGWDCCPTVLTTAKFENMYALRVNVLGIMGTEGSK